MESLKRVEAYKLNGPWPLLILFQEVCWMFLNDSGLIWNGIMIGVTKNDISQKWETQWIQMTTRWPRQIGSSPFFWGGIKTRLIKIWRSCDCCWSNVLEIGIEDIQIVNVYRKCTTLCTLDNRFSVCSLLASSLISLYIHFRNWGS